MAAAFGQAEEGAPDGGRRAVSSPETASSARSACAPVCQCVRVPAVGEKDAHTGGRNEQCAGGAAATRVQNATAAGRPCHTSAALCEQVERGNRDRRNTHRETVPRIQHALVTLQK